MCGWGPGWGRSPPTWWPWICRPAPSPAPRRAGEPGGWSGPWSGALRPASTTRPIRSSGATCLQRRRPWPRVWAAGASCWFPPIPPGDGASWTGSTSSAGLPSTGPSSPGIRSTRAPLPGRWSAFPERPAGIGSGWAGGDPSPLRGLVVPDVHTEEDLEARAGEADEGTLPCGAVEFFQALLSRWAGVRTPRPSASESGGGARLMVSGSLAAWERGDRGEGRPPRRGGGAAPHAARLAGEGASEAAGGRDRAAGPGRGAAAPGPPGNRDAGPCRGGACRAGAGGEAPGRGRSHGLGPLPPDGVEPLRVAALRRGARAAPAASPPALFGSR